MHLRPDQLREYCQVFEWSWSEFAARVELGRSSIFRYINGAQPSPSFIAACAVIFGEHSLNKLFVYSRREGGGDEIQASTASFPPRERRNGAA